MHLCLFQHIEISNMSSTKNPKHVFKKTFDFQFSYSLVFLQKKPQKHPNFHTLSKLGLFLKKTSKIKRFSNYKQELAFFSKNLQKEKLGFLQTKFSKIKRFSNYKQARFFSKNLQNKNVLKLQASQFFSKNLQDEKDFKLNASLVSLKKPWPFLGVKLVVGVL